MKLSMISAGARLTLNSLPTPTLTVLYLGDFEPSSMMAKCDPRQGIWFYELVVKLF
ncbi:hypothetical protein MKX03_001422 [Papaver bracteatum]|nr:hypothetical protein MKX03_001422 [Papaver bracteatum]